MRKFLTALIFSLPLVAQTQYTYPPKLPAIPVASLPSTALLMTVVSDGTSSTDCTVGGGSTQVVCARINGAWVAIGSAAANGANHNIQSSDGSGNFVGSSTWNINGATLFANPGGIFNLSLGLSMQIPAAASPSSTSSGYFIYDSVSKNPYFGANGLGNYIPLLPASRTPVNGNCPKWSVTGTNYTLDDTGAVCGLGPNPLTGAAGNGSTDDTAAIQTALNTVSGLTNGGPVTVGSGTFKTTSPLYSTGNNVAFGGVSKSSSIISAQFYGPVLVHHSPNYPGIVLGAALLTGTGQAQHLQPYDGVNLMWLNLGDIYPMRQLNGLSAFTIEGTFKLNGAPSNTNASISSSYGRAQATGNPTYAYRLFITSARAVSFWYTIGGVSNLVSTASAAVPTGSNTHIAVTYNGSTVTIWVNGVSSATQSASGTWSQGEYENVVLGAEVTEWPEGTANTGLLPPDTWLDSFRVSNVARYSSGFTPPTAKFTVDSSTLALINYDVETDNNIITKAYTGNGTPAYLVTRSMGDTNQINSNPVGYAERLQIKNLDFQLSGAFGPMFARSILSTVSNAQWVMGSNQGSAGPLYSDYSYQSSFNDNYILGDPSSPYCFAGVLGSGSGSFGAHNTIWNCKVQMDLNETTWNWESLYLQGGAGIRYHYLQKQLVPSIVEPTVCTECTVVAEGDDGGVVVPAYVSGQANFVGGRFEANSLPPVTVDGSATGVTFKGSQFIVNVSASEMIHIGTAPTVPVNVMNATRSSGAIPYSLTTASVIVDPGTSYLAGLSLPSVSTGCLNYTGSALAWSSCGGGSLATYSLAQWAVSISGATLTIGTNCTSNNPCLAGSGGTGPTTDNQFTTSKTAILTAGTGTAYIYVPSGSSQPITVGSTGATWSGSSTATTNTSDTNFADKSSELFACTFASGVWTGCSPMAAQYGVRFTASVDPPLVLSSAGKFSCPTCSTGSSGSTLLSFQQQGSPVTMTGSAQSIFSNVTVSSLGVGKCLRVDFALNGSSLASTTLAVTLGGTTQQLATGLATGSGNFPLSQELKICNYTDQAHQQWSLKPIFKGITSASANNGTGITNQVATTTINLATSGTLNIQCTDASGTVTGQWLTVEMLQ